MHFAEIERKHIDDISEWLDSGKLTQCMNESGLEFIEMAFVLQSLLDAIDKANEILNEEEQWEED